MTVGDVAESSSAQRSTTIVLVAGAASGSVLAQQLTSAGYDVAVIDALDQGVRRLESRSRLREISSDAGTVRAHLSRRELEVAELVAQGLSNPAIARRLWVSRPTVATHIQHILEKLNFSSRTQIAAWTVERRLTGSTA